MKVTIAILLAGCFALPAFGQSREYNGELSRPSTAATDQIIVKWRAGAAVEQRAAKLRAAGGATLQRKLRLTNQTDVVKLERAIAGAELNSVIAAIAADPDVEYAVADQWPDDGGAERGERTGRRPDARSRSGGGKARKHLTRTARRIR